MNSTSHVVSESSAPVKTGSPGCSARIAVRSSATEGSSTRYSDLSLAKVTICGSLVSGWILTSLTSASGSAASTSSAPLAKSILTSLPVFAPTELTPSIEPPSSLNAIEFTGQRVVGGNGQQRPPVRFRAVPHQHHETPVRLRRDRRPDRELRVREQADEAGVLDHLGQLAGYEVELVDVVQFGVVAVQRDQQVGRELPLRGDQPRLHAVERGEVAAVHGLEVDVVQPPVLVSAGVLQVQQVPGIVGPLEHADAAVPVVGDHPRRRPVHPRAGARRGDPDVEDPFVRSDPRQPGAIGGDGGANPLGIAEEYFPRNEFDHVKYSIASGGLPPQTPPGGIRSGRPAADRRGCPGYRRPTHAPFQAHVRQPRPASPIPCLSKSSSRTASPSR